MKTPRKTKKDLQFRAWPVRLTAARRRRDWRYYMWCFHAAISDDDTLEDIMDDSTVVEAVHIYQAQRCALLIKLVNVLTCAVRLRVMREGIPE